jgi:hypothetical protein
MDFMFIFLVFLSKFRSVILFMVLHVLLQKLWEPCFVKCAHVASKNTMLLEMSSRV